MSFVWELWDVSLVNSCDVILSLQHYATVKKKKQGFLLRGDSSSQKFGNLLANNNNIAFKVVYIRLAVS